MDVFSKWVKDMEMNQYVEFIDKLKFICKQNDIRLRYKKLADDYKLYYFTLNETKDQKTICFSSGIHGDEIAGPWSILKFLENIPKIRTGMRVLILPLANPYGFEKLSRHNYNKEDINRRFCEENLTGEAKAIYDVIKSHDVSFLHTIHEWAGTDGFYMYSSDKKREKILAELPKIASKYFKVFTNVNINKEKVENGIIWHPKKGYTDVQSKCTLENKMWIDDIPYIATETPSKANLDKRISFTVKAMNYIIENL
jgi:Succinylglutamate desuccinylase / Aspartoacylase family